MLQVGVEEVQDVRVPERDGLEHSIVAIIGSLTNCGVDLQDA
jgi:hypothetical protein